MNSTKRSIRTLLFLAVLIAILLGIMAFNKSWKPKLGLDLTGGTTITLTASNANGNVDQASLQLARTILQQRVDAIGVGESEVATSGERQIIVSVPNVQKDELVKMVGQTAQLYFRPVFDQQLVSAPVPQGENKVPGPFANSSASATAVPEGTATPTDAPSETPKQGPMPSDASPTPTPAATATANPAATAAPNQNLDTALAWQPSPELLAAFASYKCQDAETKLPATEALITCDKAGQFKYLLGPALVKGDQLTNAQAGVANNSVSWMVTLALNTQGANDFYKATTHLSQQAQPRNQFAIVLDDKVVSAPRVNAPIAGGNAEITGSFTQKEAQELANVLKYGALPLSFDLSSVDTVSASLGADQLRIGLIAGAIGLLLVLLYCLFYYHGLSIVVFTSLGIAAILTYCMMVLLGQAVGFALNLPGIAGAIVAIGITADSFVVYFERIRDEAREGRTLRTAIESGWIRSRKTILAADSVSLLSALVLFILAIGAIKGFAFTLGLTTLIDIAVVFWFTKPMMTLLGNTKFFGSGGKFSGFEREHLGATNARAYRVEKES